MIIWIFKNPILINILLDIFFSWSKKYLIQLLETKVIDIIEYSGWSESFFPPSLYRRFVYPRLKKLVDLTHKSGVKFCYAPRAPPNPLFKIFKEIGVDIFFGLDPVEGNNNFFEIKREIGDDICLWGGVNSYVTLGRGTKQDVEEAVIRAIQILKSDGGFILSAVDSLGDLTSWKNINYMIKIWKKHG
jgi:uroporphyrinogen decarboxylase